MIAAIVLGISAVLLSSIYCFLWFYSFNSWSLENLLKTNAYVLAEFGLYWSPKNYENATDVLIERFYTNATSTTKWSLGISGMTINFLGLLKDYVMCDVVLLISISLYQTMTNFIKNLETYGCEETKREDLWLQYDYMKSLSNQINDLFGQFVILIHLYNALTVAFFLMKGLTQETTVSTLLLGTTAAKVILIYFIASQTSYQVSQVTYILQII